MKFSQVNWAICFKVKGTISSKHRWTQPRNLQWLNICEAIKIWQKFIFSKNSWKATMLTTPGTPVSSSPGPSSISTTTTPAGAQHRLMLKQTPIDVWSLREQLGLASAVLRSGDQNWVSVSRQMKPFSEEGRPHDWFSQKNCALQYNLLLEKVDTPRRKRSDKSEATETPGEAIVRRLKVNF